VGGLCNQGAPAERKEEASALESNTAPAPSVRLCRRVEERSDNAHVSGWHQTQKLTGWAQCAQGL